MGQTMHSLNVNLKNCYGIRSLEHEFDFSEKKAFVIYAQNGVMKSSLAQTFKDLSENKISQDRIYTDRETTRNISHNNGNPLHPENIFVVVPYNKAFKSEKISSLLANKELKEEYDEIHKIINEKKSTLIDVLKKASGLKSDITEIFSEAITHDTKLFYNAIMRLEYEVKNTNPSIFGSTNYTTIFNDKVMAAIQDADFRAKLSQYIETYEKLVDNSTFFKKGVFNHNNADDIAKNLDSNGFFKADHSVNISIQGEKHIITNLEDLKKAIRDEKSTILDNPQLTKNFSEIDNKLIKNAELRKFRDYLDKNRHIVTELTNIDKLKQTIWIAYLVDNKDFYIDLVENYKKAKQRIEEIVEEAKKEKTRWIDVLNIFNKRFSVPFIADITNKDDVILKADVPNIEFKFKDEKDSIPKPVDEQMLLDVLSNGERRALYILNIIFEVEARKASNQETLFIIDDIADSFDYKNKYAIAEYLKDISEEDNFYQIILTHNFDFYRTMSSRLDTTRNNRLHTIKTDTGIELKQEKYQKNPFNTWKTTPQNDTYLISLIPFMRNIAEYSGQEQAENQLTSLLHIKQDTHSLKVKDIKNIMNSVFKNIDTSNITNDETHVLDLIFSTADSILQDANSDIELESKIVLAIAVRLKTEEYMISRINDHAYISAITSNQTYRLSKKFKEKFPADDNLDIISEVNLMTPENIHINSFMYEPILDMACDNLKRLYIEVSKMHRLLTH